MSLKQPRKMDFPYLYLNTIYIDKPGVEILETSTLTYFFLIIPVIFSVIRHQNFPVYFLTLNNQENDALLCPTSKTYNNY